MNKFIQTLLLIGASLQGAPLVETPQPDIYAMPGQAASWSVRVTPDLTNFVTFTATFFIAETNPTLGVYIDALGPAGGPTNFVLTPLSGMWDTIAGTYFVDPNAALGARNDVVLRMLWEEYSGDPFTCGDCFVTSGFVDRNLSVSAAEAPEPSTAIMLVLAGAAITVSRVVSSRWRERWPAVSGAGD